MKDIDIFHENKQKTIYYKVKFNCKMELKMSQYIPTLPISHLPKFDDLPSEQQYLQLLEVGLVKVLSNLQINVEQIQQRYILREEHDLAIEQKEQIVVNIVQKYQNLQRENYDLRVKMEQHQRYFKRCQTKLELLNNKIAHLSKVVAEKQAIIKYLQAKTETTQRYNSNKPTTFESLQDYSRTYSKSNLSFAKLKSTQNTLKFQDYANLSLQLDESEGSSLGRAFGGRVDRIKTQSNDSKQNEQMQNLKPQPCLRKLNEFFNTKAINRFQNQKTLAKAQSQMSGSFWQYSSKPKPSERCERRNSNINLGKFVNKGSMKDYLVIE